ncbi:MAG: hypothetical protein RRC07_13840 [Anaerolineae bacterium]|nr:hypothetical protein [Anaerolineae bacterium]
MKSRTLFVINTVIAVPFGIGSVLAPKTFLSLYGASLEPAGALMMQFGGTWLIGIGLLTWLVRDATEVKIRRQIMVALLMMYIIGFVVALLGQLSAALNALGWLVVGINAFLVLGYATTLFSQPEAAEARPLAQRG